MYRVTLICSGLPPAAGPEAAVDIAKEFAEYRRWHSRVTCEWKGALLILRSDNNFDTNGLATLDEFGDCISAYVSDPGESHIEIESVCEFGEENA